MQALADLTSQSLIGADLAGQDLTGVDLSGCDLSRANLSEATLVGANLSGAILYQARLEGAELAGANLSGANLVEVSAQRVGLGRADLSRANLTGAQLQGSTLSGADLTGADLRAANLDGARLLRSTLTDADLGRATMRAAEIADCQVPGASFRHSDLRDAKFRSPLGYAAADWVGADFRNTDLCGAYLMRRFAHDQNFLEEFRGQSPGHAVVYVLWKVTSDCGRSVTRWALWTFAIALTFAAIYTTLPIDYGDHPTPLSPLYFSIVTLTTLGYGDALPTDVPSQIAVIIQVLMGYFMLGGLLTLLSTKMGRRAD
ncbi:MAG: pentapeptide repeat-containing protein [Myxococcales bacterium]|nr:pentapeptide repeat-containing protein [Myxococcales bacterium]